MIKTIYKIQWRIQTFREGVVVVVVVERGGGGRMGSHSDPEKRGGGGFPKALVDPSGLSLF